MARILLLDDDIAEITAVKRLVARSTHRVELATTAADAARAIARDPPDLLVVAAACDGGRAVSVVRDRGADAAPLPVIVLGDAAGLPAGVRAVGLPVDPEQLGREIDGLLVTPAGRPAPSSRPSLPAPRAAPGRAASAAGAGVDGLRVARASRATAPAPVALAAAGGAEDPRGWADELAGADSTAPAEGAADAALPPRPDAAARRREEAEDEEERLRAAIASARAELEVLRRRPARPEKAPAVARRSDPPPAPAPPGSAEAAPAEAGSARDPGGAAPPPPQTTSAALSPGIARACSRDPVERQASPGEPAPFRWDPFAVPSGAGAATPPRSAAPPEGARDAATRATTVTPPPVDPGPLRPLAAPFPPRATPAPVPATPDRARARDDAAPRPTAVTPAPLDPGSLPSPDAPPRAPVPAATDPAQARDDAARRPTAVTPALIDAGTLPPLAAPVPPRATPAPALPPPPEELRAGTVAELPAPRLLALAAAARLAGRLELEGEVTRTLWFEAGRVVGATSGDPAERVEALAVRLGLVTRDQHQQVADRAARLPVRRAALLLLDAGFLKAAELSGLVRRRTEEVVFGIFGDAGARFRWEPGEVPVDERAPVERPPLALAVEGVRRRWSAGRLDAILGGPDTLLSPLEGGPPAEALALSAQEAQVAALADGLRTVAEIERASPLDALAARQVLSALVLVGALEVRRLASRMTAEEARAIDRARLADKLDQARRCDYFTVLGLPRSSSAHEAREAALRLEASLDPDRHAGGDPAVADGLGDLLQVVRDAGAVLGDDALRQAYLAGLGG